MFRNHLKMILRNLAKQLGFTIINISGLALGMACCILILLFVKDELSYDRYHEKADQIYRLVIDAEIGGSFSQYAVPPFAAAPAFTNELPEIKSFTRLFNRDGQVTYKDKRFQEEWIFFADTAFFDIFSHNFVYGNPETALEEPGAVVITEEVAAKVFGVENPIGESFKLNRFESLHVAGVVKTVPANSHFPFNYIISMQTFQGEQRDFLNRWLNINGWSYLLLEEGVDVDALQAKFADIVEKHTGQRAREVGIKMEYFLQKLTDIHLHSKLQAEIGPISDIVYVYTFSAIAVFILLIACINFMNLSTARSTMRAKEVAMRKVSGANKKNIILQFLGESVFMSICGLLLAVGIVLLVLPEFNAFAEKQMAFTALFDQVVLAGILCLTIFAGILAGSYPAFILSSFQPVTVLGGKLSSMARNAGLRKFLVVLQFSISIILIASTIIVTNQVNFMKNKHLGFEKEQVLVITMRTTNPPERFEPFRNEMLMHSNVLKASFSSGVPGRTGELRLFLPEGNERSDTHVMNLVRVDHDYLSTYKMQLSHGRDFSLDFTTDSTKAFIINETAAQKLGWAETAVGKEFEFLNARKGNIIGVIKDYHYRPVAEKIEPVVFMVAGRPGFLLSLKINADNVSETIDYIKQKWSAFEPGRPLNYYFVDEDFASRYGTEEKLGNIVGIFAILGILIAALGLFGLASFMVDRRVKEIGIRKVLGASVTNLLILICNEFAILVIVSNIIAWPIAYWVMTNYWLTNFPYSINPGVFAFLISGILSILVTLTAVGYQAIRAALTNPVESLRYE